MTVCFDCHICARIVRIGVLCVCRWQKQTKHDGKYCFRILIIENNSYLPLHRNHDRPTMWAIAYPSHRRLSPPIVHWYFAKAFSIALTLNSTAECFQFFFLPISLETRAFSYKISVVQNRSRPCLLFIYGFWVCRCVCMCRTNCN